MVEPIAPQWTVTQQVETTDLGPGGTYVSGVKITFRTAAGTVGSVFVPASDYALDVVRGRIAERAATLDAVAALTG